MYSFHERQLKSIRICVTMLNFLLIIYIFYNESETLKYLETKLVKADSRVTTTISSTFYWICSIFMVITYGIGIFGIITNNRLLVFINTIILTIVIFSTTLLLLGPFISHFTQNAMLWIVIHIFLITFQYLYINSFKTYQHSVPL